MTMRNRLLKTLKGISPYSPGPDENMFSFENVSTGNFDPPAYLVAFLFLQVLGYQDFGSFEKVWWHTFLTYRGYVFLLRDFKFGTWSLEARKGPPVPPDIIRQIVAKIGSASRQADELLSMELKKMINNEKYWLHNGYHGLKEAYDFYTAEVRGALAALRKSNEQSPETGVAIENLVARWNERVGHETVLSFRTFPLIVTFFSLLEFILDAFYAFERPAKSFLEFRRLSWQDRFKAVVPLSRGGDFPGCYEKLVRIRRQLRNPLAHGLTNETSLLVPVPYGGLVPVSYEYLNNSIHFGPTKISLPLAVEAMETFDRVITHFTTSEPFACYVRYLEHGFSIPIHKAEIARLKSKMTSVESFERYLLGKGHYLDAVTNRDI